MCAVVIPGVVHGEDGRLRRLQGVVYVAALGCVTEGVQGLRSEGQTRVGGCGCGQREESQQQRGNQRNGLELKEPLISISIMGNDLDSKVAHGPA